MRAMVDEMTRSRQLRLNDLDRPYFIQYSLGDSQQVSIEASLGGITHSTRSHFRVPGIEVRVGSAQFDNTNSVYSRNRRSALAPIDDNYRALRTSFWLASDVFYKAAIDQIARKRNALREIVEPDNTPDLAPAKAVEVLQPEPELTVDQRSWEGVVQAASQRFATHPGLAASSVELRAIASTYRLVNTEGTRLRIPETLAELQIQCSALAPDGNRVWNHALVTMLSPKDLPSRSEVNAMAESIAQETDALSHAPKGDDYTGPVLFEHEAAAAAMAQMLTDAVRLQRRPVAPPGSAPQILNSVWSSRLGSKVAPEWLSIIDDPRQPAFHGVPLAGYYEIDDEGVPSEKAVVVDKGTLRGYLLTREPVRQFDASNGHGRLPGAYGSEQAVIGNLFVQAEKTVRDQDMKRRLLAKVKTAGLKYGIIIRKIDFPSTANLQELESIVRQLQKNGYARTLGQPLVAYRVYPDGREELVRGLRFGEFSAKDLRDVDSASDRPWVFNYVNNGSTVNIVGSGSDLTTSSVVCPSLLFESVDLLAAENEVAKPPIVPAPELTQ
jgi:predicted Zn-dependent protease